MSNEEVAAKEELAKRIHAVYQEVAGRLGDKRWTDDYDSLPEHIKEYDRAIARFILENYRRKEE